MRLKRIATSIKADFLFQLKHGFYYVYIILALMYLIILSQFNQDIAKIILPIVIYIDPAVLGLFFIGGIVLLEKEQGILSLLYITPLRVWEYILSKLVTLTAISTLAGVAIAYLSYSGKINIFLLLIGIILTAVCFTLLGFIIATKAKSVNHYIVRVAPAMALFSLPCFSLIPNSIVPKFADKLLMVIPSVAALKITLAAFLPYSNNEIVFCIIWLLVFDILLLIKTKDLLEKNIAS